MTAMIHATAVVEPGARIDPSATVGAFCSIGRGVVLSSEVRVGSQAVLEGEVSVGVGSSVGNGAVIRGRAVIGARTTIFPYAIIGEIGQFPGQTEAGGMVQIGDDATLREFVIVNQPVTTMVTRIGDGCYLMARTQVDHDCILGGRVKAATGVTLGGSVQVGADAYLGMNAVVHQGLRIGEGCMIGMNGVVTAHVPPFTTLVNRRVTRLNTTGLLRLGASPAEIAGIAQFYRAADEAGPADDRWIRVIQNFLDGIPSGPIARFAWSD